MKRVSGVATAEESTWRLRQTHFSLPVAGQEKGSSFPGRTEDALQPAVEALRRSIMTADHTTVPDIYTEDAVLDVHLPGCYYALHGADRIRQQLDEWHPVAPKLERWTVRPTDCGAVVELALWEGEDNREYSESIHVLDVSGGNIAKHRMYCTGDWTPDEVNPEAAMQTASAHPSAG